MVTTLVGSGSATLSDGVGSGASFSGPLGVCTDSVGSLWVADTSNNCIRKISSSGLLYRKLCDLAAI